MDWILLEFVVLIPIWVHGAYWGWKHYHAGDYAASTLTGFRLIFINLAAAIFNVMVIEAIR
jgi:hypothetical protein